MTENCSPKMFEIANPIINPINLFLYLTNEICTHINNQIPLICLFLKMKILK